MALTRRRMITLAAGAALPMVAPWPGDGALAATEDARARIAEFAAGREPLAGRITLTVPEVAENGNTVPVSVAVDSAMTGEDMVASVLILADGNPQPEVATFHFSALSGVVAATTRMRLARTQTVTALAKMADGAVYMASVEVEVTVGGCGG